MEAATVDYDQLADQFGGKEIEPTPIRVSIPQVAPGSKTKDTQEAFEKNNPGYIRYPGTKQFRVYDSPEAGYQDVEKQIENHQQRGHTLEKYISTYAPENENDTETYIKNAENALGVKRDTLLSQIPKSKLAEFQIHQESGSTVGPDYETLADKFGGKDVTAEPAVDYDALAEKFGGKEVTGEIPPAEKVPGMEKLGEPPGIHTRPLVPGLETGTQQPSSTLTAPAKGRWPASWNNLAQAAWDVAKNTFHPDVPAPKLIAKALGTREPQTVEQYYEDTLKPALLRPTAELRSFIKDAPGGDALLAFADQIGGTAARMADFSQTALGIATGGVAGAAERMAVKAAVPTLEATPTISRVVAANAPSVVRGAFAAGMAPEAAKQVQAFAAEPTAEQAGRAAGSVVAALSPMAPEVAGAAGALAGRADLAAKIDAHNVEATRLVEQDRQAGLKTAPEQEFEASVEAGKPKLAKPMEVQTDAGPVTVAEVGRTPKYGSFYQVKDAEGKVIHAGSADAVRSFLDQEGASPEAGAEEETLDPEIPRRLARAGVITPEERDHLLGQSDKLTPNEITKLNDADRALDVKGKYGQSTVSPEFMRAAMAEDFPLWEQVVREWEGGAAAAPKPPQAEYGEPARLPAAPAIPEDIGRSYEEALSKSVEQLDKETAKIPEIRLNIRGVETTVPDREALETAWQAHKTRLDAINRDFAKQIGPEKAAQLKAYEQAAAEARVPTYFPPETAATSTEPLRPGRPVGERPTVPEIGTPERVSRVQDARERLAPQLLDGRSWQEATNPERLVIDSMVTQGYGFAVTPEEIAHAQGTDRRGEHPGEARPSGGGAGVPLDVPAGYGPSSVHGVPTEGLGRPGSAEPQLFAGYPGVPRGMVAPATTPGVSPSVQPGRSLQETAPSPTEAQERNVYGELVPAGFNAQYDRFYSQSARQHPDWGLKQLQREAYDWASAWAATRERPQQPEAQTQGGVAKTGGPGTEDIITGTHNLHLDDDGRADAEKQAKNTSNVEVVNTGPMDRTKETAEPIKEENPDVKIQAKNALAPWNLGEFEGRPQHEVNEQINDYMVNRPNKPVPGGESYNAYKGPLIGEIQKQVAAWKPGERVLNITHSIGVHTLQAWAANGAPEDKSINTQAMLNRQKLKQTALFRIDPRTMQMTEAENTKQDGIFIERHAETPWDNIKPEDEAGMAKPPTVATAPAAQPAAPPTVQQNVERAQTLRPEVAASLAEGSTRVNPKGGVETLTSVPLDKVHAISKRPEGIPEWVWEERGGKNTMYPEVTQRYVDQPSPVAPELREQPNGNYVIWDGHHRVEAARKRGEKSILAWTSKPGPDGLPEVPGAAATFAGKTAANRELIKNEIGKLHVESDGKQFVLSGVNDLGVLYWTHPGQKTEFVVGTPAYTIKDIPSLKGESEEPREFSSTQFNLGKDFADAIRKFGEKIPKEDLAEDGVETEPHVTLLYGLEQNEPSGVVELLKGEGPITMTFGATSVFPASESGDSDVLKVAVTSPELHKLNQKIALLPHTSTHPTYHPHVTIAYMKPGTAAKWANRPVPNLTGKTVTLDTVTFSPRTGEKTEISLRAEKAPKKMAAAALAAPAPGPRPALATGTEISGVDFATVESRVAESEAAIHSARHDYERLEDLYRIASLGRERTLSERDKIEASEFGKVKQSEQEDEIRKHLILAARKYEEAREAHDRVLADAAELNPMLTVQTGAVLPKIDIPADEAADSNLKASTDSVYDAMAEIAELEKRGEEQMVKDALPDLQRELKYLDSDIADLPHATPAVLDTAREVQATAQKLIERIGAPEYSPPLAPLPESENPGVISNWLGDHRVTTVEKNDEIATYGNHVVYPLNDGRLVWAHNTTDPTDGHLLHQKLVAVSPMDEDLEPDFKNKETLREQLEQAIGYGELRPEARDRIMKMFDRPEPVQEVPPPSIPEPEPIKAEAKAPEKPTTEMAKIATRRPLRPTMEDVEATSKEGLTKAQQADMIYQDGWRAFPNLHPGKEQQRFLEVFDPYEWKWRPAGEYTFSRAVDPYGYGGYRAKPISSYADEKKIGTYAHVKPGPLSQDDLNEATKSFDADSPGVTVLMPKTVQAGMEKMDKIFSAQALWKFRQSQLQDAANQLSQWRRAYERSPQWDELLTSPLNQVLQYGRGRYNEGLEAERRQQAKLQSLADRMPESATMDTVKASAEKDLGSEEALTAYKDGWRVVKYHYQGRKPTFTVSRFDPKNWEWDTSYGARSVDKTRAMAEFSDSSKEEPLTEAKLQETIKDVWQGLSSYGKTKRTPEEIKAGEREQALPDHKPNMDKPFTYEAKGEGVRYFLNFPNGEKWGPSSWQPNVFGRSHVIDAWDGPKLDEQEAKSYAVARWWDENLDALRKKRVYSGPEYVAKVNQMQDMAAGMLAPAGRPRVIATRQDGEFKREYSVVPTIRSNEHVGYQVKYKSPNGEWESDHYNYGSDGNTYDQAIEMWLNGEAGNVATYEFHDPVAKEVAGDLEKTNSLKVDMAAAQAAKAKEVKRTGENDELPQSVSIRLPNKTIKEMVPILRKVIEKRSTIPILHNIAIINKGGKTKIIGTDLETSVTFTLPGLSKEDGAVTLPLAAIETALKVKSKEDLAIKTDGSKAELAIGSAESGAETMGIANYPELPAVPQRVGSVPVGELLKAIRAVISSISPEESRFTLNGALLKLEPGKVTLVATDGHRLTLKEFDAPGIKEAQPPPVETKVGGETEMVQPALILKRNALETITKAFAKEEGNLELKFGNDAAGNLALVGIEKKDGSLKILTRRLEGNFPDYRRVLPDESTYTDKATVNREALLGLINQAVALKTKSGSMGFSFRDGQIFGIVQESDATTKGRVPATLQGLGERAGKPGNPRLALNSRYVADFLKSTDADEVEILLKDIGKEANAVVFRPVGDPRTTAIIMPMRETSMDFDDGMGKPEQEAVQATEPSGDFSGARIPFLDPTERAEPFITGAPDYFHAAHTRLEPIELDARDQPFARAYVTSTSGMELTGRAVGMPRDIFGRNHIGVHITPEGAARLASRLERMTRPDFGQSLPYGVQKLIDAARAAATDNRSLVLVADRAGWEGYRDTSLAEEVAHAIQARVAHGSGPGAHLASTLPGFMGNPLAERAAATLGYYQDLTSGQMAAEIGVRLMRQDGWKELGLTKPQARLLAANYVRALRREHGSQAPRQIAARVFEGFVGTREPGRVPQGARPEGGEGTPGTTGSDLSPAVEDQGVQDTIGDQRTREPGSGTPNAFIPEARGTVTGERGAVDPTLLTIGLNKFVEQDVVPTAKETASTLASAADDILKIALPTARGGPQTAEAAYIMRYRMSELAHRMDQAQAAVAKARQFFEKKGDQFGKDFILEYFADETGTLPQTGNVDLDAIAKTIRRLNDEFRDEVQALGTGKLQSYYTNYFAHVWKDWKKAQSVFASFFGRKPLEGPKGFLKKRTHINFQDALDAGLEPVSWNPIDLTMMKLSEMGRYVMAHKVLDDWKKAGLARFVDARAGRAAAAWFKIDDPIGAVWGPSIQQISEYPNEGLYVGLMKTAEALGVTHKRGFDSLRGAIGRASQGGKTVKTLHGTAEQVLAHEIGHQIDWLAGSGDRFMRYGSPQIAADIKQARTTLGDKSSTPDQRKQARDTLKGYQPQIKKQVTFNKELRALADLRGGPKSYTHKREEKMALLAEAWVGAREQFQKTAPNVFAEWKRFLTDNPNLHKLRDIEGGVSTLPLSQPYDVGGLVLVGNWYAPEGAARILNNHLTPGLIGNSGIYRSILGLNNVIQQFQLGLSGFHVGFTTAEVAVSRAALGIEQALRGHPVKGALTFAQAPLATFQTWIKGNKVLREWYNSGTQGPAVAEIVRQLELAGGRAKTDRMYMTHIGDRMMHAFRNGNWFGGLLRAPFAAVEAVTQVIMREIVPRQKLGVFAELAAWEIERLGPNATFEETRAALAKAWDSVDNRLGLMTYDNLFWNRTAKDIAMLTVRSVGWNLGTLREVGGGAADVLKMPVQMAGGKPPKDLNLHRISYLLALAIVPAIIGAMYQYLKTGQGPQELKDYYFPKDGELDDRGRPERISPPTYIPQIYEMAVEPKRTITNKMAPIWGLMGDMIRNQDFYGTEIRNEDDPVIQQMLQAAEAVGRSMEPISARNIQKEMEQGGPISRRFETFFGARSAPAAIEQTKAERLAQDLARAEIPEEGRTREQAARRQAEVTIARLARSGREYADQAADYVASGILAPKDIRQAITRSATPSLIREFQRLPVTDALRVWSAATPGEKDELRPMLLKKFQSTRKLPPAQQRAILPRLETALTQ